MPGRARTQARQQLILDLSRADVCDYIIEAVSSVLRSAPISYVKWDMNRNMTEIGSALLDSEHQGEVEHRYMLGLYRVLETITQSFPDVLFESCSGGGGRFDAGLLLLRAADLDQRRYRRYRAPEDTVLHQHGVPE